MAKYLGENGLSYLWGKIKAWVADYLKITASTGKDTITSGNVSIDIYDWAQASTKPSYTQDEVTDGTTYKRFSSTEQTKLSGIATGAEVNQNAFSKIKVSPASGSSTDIDADTKTDTLELKAGDHITLTPDATNDKITISASGGDPATSTPEMDGTAAVGTSTKYAREDHVHPTDTSRAASSHTHGNITNEGALQTSDISIASGDKIVVTDSSDSGKVARTSITFDGSTTSQALTKKGTWETFLNSTNVGVANGICPLDANTLIDSQYLPSYVDDVVEAYARAGQTALSSTWLATGSASGTVITPSAGKIYVLMEASGDYTANTEFRWGGSTYVKINDGGIAEMTTSEMDTATNNWT